MKKSIAIFCFTALLLSTSSLSLFYWLEEKWHEQERFSSIDKGEFKAKGHQIKLLLDTKSVLPDGYHWEEKGREFSHNGMFYDIVSFSKTDAGWELVAVSDNEEAEIVAKQSKAAHIEKNVSDNKKSNKQKYNLNFSLFEKGTEQVYQTYKLQLDLRGYFNYQVLLTEPFLGQISPPPKSV